MYQEAAGDRFFRILQHHVVPSLEAHKLLAKSVPHVNPRRTVHLEEKGFRQGVIPLLLSVLVTPLWYLVPLGRVEGFKSKRGQGR